jgi:N-(2-amino-2-carboxyethyl)-L-glutamate synthase
MTISMDGVRLTDACTRTPLAGVRLRYRGTEQHVLLKLELHNPTGSIKYRTAIGLLYSMHRERPLAPGTTIVESTSGNLGLALAWLAGELGCSYVAVVDPKLPQRTAARLRAVGAELAMVHEHDEYGGYLLSRLHKVRQMCADGTGARWPNQYENYANPAIHYNTISVELLAQTGGRIDAVAVAVSTGGTLAGISECLRRAVPSARLLAVDVMGSVVMSDRAHPHLMTGIGSTRKSSFLRPSHYDEVWRVSDVEAFAYCRMLAQDTGLTLGGSSGALLAAVAKRLGSNYPRARNAVLVCPDGGENYQDTIYDDGWLTQRDALDSVLGMERYARTYGMSFAVEGDVDGRL